MKQNKTPEYIALTLALYSFIIFILMCASFRVFGLAWFQPNYSTLEVSIVTYKIVMGALHFIEGFFILKFLTDIKARYCIIIAFLYMLLSKFIENSTLQFLLDVLYIITLPFIFNKNKDKSILISCAFIVLICLYQILMMYGRYDLALTHKYDLAYMLLSTIDYKVFLLTLVLYKFKRRYKYGR